MSEYFVLIYLYLLQKFIQHYEAAGEYFNTVLSCCYGYMCVCHSHQSHCIIGVYDDPIPLLWDHILWLVVLRSITAWHSDGHSSPAKHLTCYSHIQLYNCQGIWMQTNHSIVSHNITWTGHAGQTGSKFHKIYFRNKILKKKPNEILCEILTK